MSLFFISNLFTPCITYVQLGIIATKNGKAEKVMELGCNASQILSVLKSQAAIPCKGEPSLQNACEMALRTLK
jgi:transcription initiation factor TFIIH subunit 2